MFEKDIKQRQLPWSVDMLADMKLFCKDIYHDFIEKSNKINQAQKQKKIEKDLL